ncbi:MAG TPA: hypothetical protein VFJ77_07700 [Gaiellaceae bacterium]|nr:hypothetical protein [Gaiellaceae bacterium]
MRWWLRSGCRAWVVGIAAAGALLLAGAASGAWVSLPAGGPQSLVTATLDAPTGLGAVHGTCVRRQQDQIVLGWTASTSPAVGGYEIFRSTSSGGPYSSLGTVSGRTTTSYADSNLPFNTTYYYVVKASRANWRSGYSGQASLQTNSTNCK